jgi:hypothetical protein
VVRYEGYWLQSPFVQDVTVTQHWRRDAASGRWFVRPEIEKLRAAVRGRIPGA